jgi:hypothetical protein
MNLKLLTVLFLTQYSTVFGSLVEDDLRNSLEKIRVSSLTRTLEAPALNYEDMCALFLHAPRPQTLVLEDVPTGSRISWKLEWHSTYVRPSDLKVPSSEYKPCISMQSAQGLTMMLRNNRFVSYRVEFEHIITKEVISPFYNVFYLKNPQILLNDSSSLIPLENLVTPAPRIARETIAIPAPAISMDSVAPFMKTGNQGGLLILPDPIDADKSYQWNFVWHSPFNRDFFMKHPKSDFTYQVSFIEDRGLDEKHSSMPFASYKVYVENTHTLEITDPFLVFYLQRPALA